ncbi:hypothetical protein RM11_0428 [Bartonella quintana RM-11]|nr:hypothetical protein RM11_0428 [Bartonella quintana RM-11]
MLMTVINKPRSAPKIKPIVRSTIPIRLSIIKSDIFTVMMEVVIRKIIKITINVVINATILLEIYCSKKGNMGLNENSVATVAIAQEINDNTSRENPRSIARKAENRMTATTIPSRTVMIICLFLIYKIPFCLNSIQVRFWLCHFLFL